MKIYRKAVSNGLVEGYVDGTFKPGKAVTRAEFAVMLMNALKPQGEGAALITRAEMAAIIANALKLSIESDSTTGFRRGKKIINKI
ncbi:S-layer homology domain-containing protein [Paenibacillus harenae]|uniref:S-layer homology domain-containing protein n=1 Tax=Paenibacillus harenae TaxID=306543 RepID=UPI0027D92A9E|nr:S-layer homology domain-containing protein [Paenibacillus harenae]